jgi:hypothetical protein
VALLASQLRCLFDVIGRFGLLSHVNRISLNGSIGFSCRPNQPHQPQRHCHDKPGRLIGLVRSVTGPCLIASSASVAYLARRLISFISLVGSSTHRLFCERLATAVNEVTKITWRLKQAAALGVATLQFSAYEIANATMSYYHAASLLHMHSLVREKMWWWLALARKKMWRWIASFGESYNGDVLQYAKQLFSLRLPQMTKYCVMRSVTISTHGYVQLVT